MKTTKSKVVNQKKPYLNLAFMELMQINQAL